MKFEKATWPFKMENSNEKMHPAGLDAVRSSLRKWLQAVLEILEGNSNYGTLIQCQEELKQDLLESIEAEGIKASVVKTVSKAVDNIFNTVGKLEAKQLNSIEVIEAQIKKIFKTRGAAKWLKNMKEILEPLMTNPSFKRLMERIKKVKASKRRGLVIELVQKILSLLPNFENDVTVEEDDNEEHAGDPNLYT